MEERFFVVAPVVTQVCLSCFNHGHEHSLIALNWRLLQKSRRRQIVENVSGATSALLDFDLVPRKEIPVNPNKPSWNKHRVPAIYALFFTFVCSAENKAAQILNRVLFTSHSWRTTTDSMRVTFCSLPVWNSRHVGYGCTWVWTLRLFPGRNTLANVSCRLTSYGIYQLQLQQTTMVFFHFGNVFVPLQCYCGNPSEYFTTIWCSPSGDVKMIKHKHDVSWQHNETLHSDFPTKYLRSIFHRTCRLSAQAECVVQDNYACKVLKGKASMIQIQWSRKDGRCPSFLEGLQCWEFHQERESPKESEAFLWPLIFCTSLGVLLQTITKSGCKTCGVLLKTRSATKHKILEPMMDFLCWATNRLNTNKHEQVRLNRGYNAKAMNEVSQNQFHLPSQIWKKLMKKYKSWK